MAIAWEQHRKPWNWLILQFWHGDPLFDSSRGARNSRHVPGPVRSTPLRAGTPAGTIGAVTVAMRVGLCESLAPRPSNRGLLARGGVNGASTVTRNWFWQMDRQDMGRDRSALAGDSTS